MISRRAFLESTVRGLPAAGGLTLLAPFLSEMAPAVKAAGGFARDTLEDLLKTAPVARFWSSTAKAGGDCKACHASDMPPGAKTPHDRQNLVQCGLCAQRCALRAGERGKCRARIHIRGELRSLVYGRPVAIHVDPIEKKPLYHFLPGAAAFSLSTTGCPFRCRFCQNWEISQARPEDYSVPFTPPSEIAGAASNRQAPVIAFTYNEPTVFAEYLLDIARAARPKGIRSVMISCGFMSEEPLREICENLDAIKVDLKGFSPDFYRQVSGGELQPVLRSIRQISRSKVHLEIVNLVVPTLNDSETMLRELVAWLAGEIGPDVPVHFTRFHPDYQLQNLPPTPVSSLERARQFAREKGLRYAYVGNIPGHEGNHTYCPGCSRAVVRRNGFFISEMNVKDGRCVFCKQSIAGVWSLEKSGTAANSALG